MKNIWRLAGLIPNYRRRIASLIVVNAFLGATGAASPYVFKLLIDRVVEITTTAIDYDLAVRGILVVIAVAAGIRLLGVVFGYFQERVNDRAFIDMMWQLRQKIFAHLNKLSIDYFERNRVGEIVEKIHRGTYELAGWVTRVGEGALENSFLIIFALTVLWISAPAAGLITTVVVPLGFIFSINRVIKTAHLRSQWRRHGEEASAELTETITHVSTVHSFSQENFRLQRYLTAVERFMVPRLAQFQIEWRTNFISGVTRSAGLILSVAIISFQVLNGNATVGDIFLVTLYYQMITGNVMPLTRLIIATGEVDSSAERLVEILDVKPTLADKAGAKTLEKIETIEFKNVAFKYPGTTRPILKDVSFTVAGGKKLALAGSSGVGKTTITKLLLRFYRPTGGEILINGEPADNFTQDSIRSRVGTVMQEVALFNDTVEENLRFAKSEADPEELVAAAKVAHADEFVRKLPDGYQSVVGERGIKLSGGEKQRIAIARAILRDPDLVILDEATSSLDSESERFVQDALSKLLEGRATVIIAHRFSTVMHADEIVFLADGKVAERGTHQQLLEKGGQYAQFYKLQSHAKPGSTVLG